MQDRQQLTKETYDKIAESWEQSHSNLDFWEKEFEVFQKLLPQGKVLDVGCGPGHHAQFLREVYDYTGIDYSNRFIELAKQKFPTATFVLGDILDLPFTEKEFDGFWAAASLLHIPKKKVVNALSEIRRVTKEGGIGFIALKTGDGERVVVDEDNTEDKRFFAYWQKEEFENVLKKLGFKVIDFIENPVSTKTIWLTCFVQV